MENEDYFNARLAYSRILQDNKDHPEALEMIKQINEIEAQLQRERETELLNQGRERERIRRDIAFIDQRRKEGIEALEKGDYQKAIEKWEEALQRDPNNQQIRDYLERAREELDYTVNLLFARAEQLIRQANYTEAYKVLDNAEDLTEGNESLTNRVIAERQKLDRAVNFITNYQRGERLYGEGNYDSATRYFERALRYDPDNTRAKDYFQSSKARAQGRKLDMDPEVRRIYLRGMDLYKEGKYEEAKTVWEEALQLDPHNLIIQRAIEGVNKKIEAYRKK
jgi:tetratricopeptide (TPR) repeat protein